jgi:hypothetical protein
MAIRFKLSNSKPADGRMAYGQVQGDYAGTVNQPGWIHFSNFALNRAHEAADERDPIVIFQAFYNLKVTRVITHVVVPTGRLVENRPVNFDKDFPHQMPVHVLARIRNNLLGLKVMSDGIQQRVTLLPPNVARMDEVVWQAGQPLDHTFYVGNGSPHLEYGGASVQTATLLAVLENGHFDLAPDALGILQRKSQAGLNH